MRRNFRALILVSIIVIVSVLALSVQKININEFERGGDALLGLNLGLDLQGGSHLVYQASLQDPETGEPITVSSEQMDSLVKTIERRINMRLVSTNEYGFHPQAIEAMAFGWMAQQRIEKKPLAVMDTKGLLGRITKSK